MSETNSIKSFFIINDTILLKLVNLESSDGNF